MNAANDYRILLLEDDQSLGESTCELLEKQSYRVVWVQTIAQARRQLDQGQSPFDLLLLDVGLPDGSGFDIAQEQQGRYPVIILTALNSAEHRLKGYELGAQEYIPKPFHLKELLIRIEKTMHLYQREEAASDPLQPLSYRYHDFTIHPAAQTIEHDGQTFYPSVRDFSVLLFLIHHSPNVVSRTQLLDHCWGQDSFPSNRTVDNTVLRIRQFLGERATDYLKSVRGVGYQWIKESL